MQNSSSIPYDETERRRIAAEIFQAEEARWRRRIDDMKAQIQALKDSTCGRFSALRLRHLDRDPALADRFREFRATADDAGRFLSEALELAWDQARAALRDGSRSRLMSPGEPAPASGQYEIVDPDGASTGVERTAVRGRPLPPTPEAGDRYRLVDSTRNDAGVLEEV